MICPTCTHDNLPGAEQCSRCMQDLTQLDMPMPFNNVERSLLEDSVELLSPRQPVTVRATMTVGEALRTMLAHDIGSLLVVDERGKLVGIFSERDLLTKVAGSPVPDTQLTVQGVMTANPETVGIGDSLAFAMHKMDVGGYRHLPVIKDGAPVGVVSVRDMLRHITRLCKGC